MKTFRVLALLLTLILLSRPLISQSGSTVELAPGVFVRSGGSCNQAFVIFRSFVLVFDPGSVPDARELLAEINKRTEKPVRYVVSSHFHPDHSAGAAVFAAAGAEVVAHEAARHDYAEWVPEDFARKTRDHPDVYKGLEFAPPTRYLAEAWTLDDGDQRIEIAHYGHGHTSGDLVGWMPTYGILFSADLSTNGQHNLGNADISEWIAILERLQDLAPRQVVPGHGSLAGPELLAMSHRFLVLLETSMKELVEKGMSYEEALSAIEIPFYEEWSGVSIRDQPDSVLRAYLQAGGEVDEPLFTKRRVATGIGILGILVLATGLIWLRGRLTSGRSV